MLKVMFRWWMVGWIYCIYFFELMGRVVGNQVCCSFPVNDFQCLF